MRKAYKKERKTRKNLCTTGPKKMQKNIEKKKTYMRKRRVGKNIKIYGRIRSL
jgi:hypothetical protein